MIKATQLAFEPFGVPVEVIFHARRRRAEVKAAPIFDTSPAGRAERAAETAETFAVASKKAADRSWAAYFAAKKLLERGS